MRDDLVFRISNLYPYISMEDAMDIADKAIGFLIMIKYNTKVSISPENIQYSYADKIWLYQCTDVIIERMGISSAVAYHENGVTMNFDSSILPLSLIQMMPRVIGTL